MPQVWIRWWRYGTSRTRFRARRVSTPMPDSQGHLHGFAKVLRDETERTKSGSRWLRLSDSIKRTRTRPYERRIAGNRFESVYGAGRGAPPRLSIRPTVQIPSSEGFSCRSGIRSSFSLRPISRAANEPEIKNFLAYGHAAARSGVPCLSSLGSVWLC